MNLIKILKKKIMLKRMEDIDKRILDKKKKKYKKKIVEARIKQIEK